MKTWTHADLVARASRWLRNTYGCKIALEEFPIATGEIPDAIGWKMPSGRSVLIECKTSRADFLRDKEKPFRAAPHMGVGAERYYLIPDGAFEIDMVHELPIDWGLLKAKGNSVKVAVPARPRKDLRSAEAMKYELRALVAALARVEYRLQPATLTEWMKAEHMATPVEEMQKHAHPDDTVQFELGKQGWIPVIDPNDLPVDEVTEEPYCPVHECLFKDCVCLGPYEARVEYQWFGSKLYGMAMRTV